MLLVLTSILCPGMSSLRRRILGESSSTEPSRDPSPTKGEPVALVPASHLKKLTSKRRWSKRRQGLIFGLGGLFGVVIAALFANHHDVINLEGLMDMNLESLLDVIPAGIVKDAKDITVRQTCSYPN
jgi:phospholipid:diacylglycerol acyltransferase